MRSPLALVDYGAEPAVLGSRTAPGGNLAIRRAALARIGGFAAHLGKLRGTLRSGEDHDLCQRCVAAGLEAMYWPAARVTHWVPADRMRIRYFLRWFFWSGITHAALEQDEPRRGRFVFGVPLYLARRLASGLAGGCAAVASGDVATAVERATDAAFAIGYAAARWRIVAVDAPRALRAVS